MNDTLTIHTDGGARGNPGPAAIGVQFKIGEWELLHGRCIGGATNNVAEYQAVKDAVEKIPEILLEYPEVTTLAFFLDSQLVARQIMGIYKIKEPTLQVFAKNIQEHLQRLAKPYSFTYVPRAQNAIADKLVNQALDGKL
jgi:ribonuclease HI